MTRKLTQAESYRIDVITVAARKVMDAAGVLHETIFSEANKQLVHHPQFKHLVVAKENAIKHLFRIEAALEKLRAAGAPRPMRKRPVREWDNKV